MRQRKKIRRFAMPLFLASAVVIGLAVAGPTVPPEIKQPGTQPGEVNSFATNCDSCHAGTDNPEFEPSHGWKGSMMSHSMRDPLFWATVAVAEQDFIPNADPELRGGAGDLCLRCHGPNGWLGGRSEPTDGSLFTGNDDRGVECESCHLMVDPDQPVNIVGTVEEQTAPFTAYDATTGEGYYGSGQYVINGNGTRLGPYAEGDETANHAALGSPFHRSGDFCGTCHDVSNPAVGDLAHNNGAQLPLQAGNYSGVLGGPAEDKAAFKNPPYAYGVVERTYSEWKASALDTLRVNDYNTLPADLRAPGGSLDVAYHRAYDAVGDADYVDGTPRFFTCQTCHMSAATGEGCNKNGTPIRTDLPRHDLTGSGYWMPDVINYQDAEGTLLFGGGLDQATRDAMTDGKARAVAMLDSAASLSAVQAGNRLTARVTNLTGHKLISGYPEGRRMWLNVRWLDGSGALIGESGGYGAIGRVVQDLDGDDHQVQSLLNPASTVIYQAEPGMDQQWASQLLALGYDANLPLTYDRISDAPEHTLGQLAALAPGQAYHSFHFVLNNVLLGDTRIPPYGMSYDEALTRSALPVPATQFGNPGPGGSFDHWSEVQWSIPVGAETAELRLYYQQTSWEYIQFLWLANDGQSSFLGQEGVNLLDAYLNTGASAPVEMEMTSVALAPSSGTPGEAAQMLASYNRATGQIELSYSPACDAVDHNIYIGDLAQVGSYGYSDVTCAVGASGNATFDPGSGNYFFLVVGNDGVKEGSYGRGSNGVERPEDVGTPTCDRLLDLTGVTCE